VPRVKRRKDGSEYKTFNVNPHRHVLPRGEQWSTPANDRECVPHRVGNRVQCAVEGCERFLGHHCKDCGRVV
jgi:hypothetical protein